MFRLRRTCDLTVGIAHSNLDAGMEFRLMIVVCCVGSGLCDKLIAGAEESCRICVRTREQTSLRCDGFIYNPYNFFFTDCVG